VVITLDFEKYLYEVIKRPRFDFGWEKIVSIYAIIIWFYKSGYYTIGSYFQINPFDVSCFPRQQRFIFEVVAPI